MKIDAQFLGQQYEYSRWASERSIDAARLLTTDELSVDLRNSHGGVLGTLVHLFEAERIWLSRLEGKPRFSLSDPGENWTLDTLGKAWTEVADRFGVWIKGVSDVESNLDYKNLAGQSHSIPIWQVLLHVVNHATYHRGQITTMLRQLGHKPVPTDLHVFYQSCKS